MKLFKQIQALMLAVIMAVMTIGSTTAFAAETTNEEVLVPESTSVTTMENRSGLTTLVNQSFSMSGTHTGSTRTYNRNNLGVICSFTDMNGNTPADGTILSIQLYDASGNFVTEWQGSNGSVLGPTVPITYGGRYYFRYAVAYGTQNLKLHVLIVSGS